MSVARQRRINGNPPQNSSPLVKQQYPTSAGQLPPNQYTPAQYPTSAGQQYSYQGQQTTVGASQTSTTTYKQPLSNHSGPLSLQQIIEIYGNRIISLEKTVRDLETKIAATPVSVSVAHSSASAPTDEHIKQVVISLLEKYEAARVVPVASAATMPHEVSTPNQSFELQIDEIYNEFNARYELITKEVLDIKSGLLTAQTFIMSEVLDMKDLFKNLLQDVETKISTIVATAAATTENDATDAADETTVIDYFSNRDNAETSELPAPEPAPADESVPAPIAPFEFADYFAQKNGDF